MRSAFAWNEFADQPHNVAPRSERTRHHLRHWRTYFSMAWADILYGIPGLAGYRRLRKRMYADPVEIRPDMFAVSVSPVSGRSEEIISHLKETGVRETLVRIPSWEMDKLDAYERFIGLLKAEGFGLTIALLQRREDVFNIDGWTGFISAVFSRFRSASSFFEIGHAWNRTKWGVWDYTEYLKLAEPAFKLRDTSGVKLVGPAVIDFEFHLYPPTLSRLPFDKASSLLYVDRVGAPENAQFGWTAEMKIAMFKALAEGSLRRECGCWITEVNWPLQGTGPYSPAAGKPNVTEDEQADYLVRYYIIGLASGLIERVFWWQLVAPGYGLVDNRETPWRRRPGFAAMTTLRKILSGSTFTGRSGACGSRMYFFRKNGADFAACWTTGRPAEVELPKPAAAIVDRNGERHVFSGRRVRVSGSPIYVFFET
jgi:hypothetical protein